MPILKRQDFKAALPPKTRILGIDVGTKTFGLAISDGTHTIATPLKTINRQKMKDDVVAYKQIIDEYNIGGCIVGWPLNMNGTEGPRCQATRGLMHSLLTEYHLQNSVDEEMPVMFWDERLSTQAMEKSLIREQNTNRKKRAKIIDQMAAQFILQGALDCL